MSKEDKYSGRRGTVVVTGGSGFIGQHLVRALLQRGQNVRVIDRQRNATEGSDHVQADLAEDDVAEVLRADAVFHLAGYPGVRGDDADSEWKRIRDNVIATENVLRWTPHDVPVVFTSSSSVYGGTRGLPCREDGPLAPRGGYAWSKVAAERACLARARMGGRVNIARLFTVLGEGQRKDMALAMWVDAVQRGQPVRVFGDLRRSRDFTDVAQVVDVLLRLHSQPAPLVVNVGTGVGQSVAALLNAIKLQTGCSPEVELVPAPTADPDATLADTCLVQCLVGRSLTADLPALVRRYLLSRLPAVSPNGRSLS